MRPCLSLLLLATVASQTAAQGTNQKAIALSAPNATLDAEFTSISAVRELADGRVLVLDQAEKKLFVADWARGSVTPVGRNGSGPGEYRQPSSLLPIAGDSTILSDWQSGRWLMLSHAQIAETIGPDAPAMVAGARRLLGADNSGRVIFTRGLGSTAGATAARPRLDSTLLLRAARANGRVDTVGTMRARKAELRVQGPADNPTSVEIVTHPLSSPEQAALFADGWIAIARQDPYRVDWRAADGRRVLGKPLPFERVRLDAGEQEAFMERQATRTGNPKRDPRSYANWPEVFPPYLMEALLPAPDGRLWIRRPPSAEHIAPPYDVIDRTGQLVERVSAGENVHVVGFGRASIYTVATDEDGIQRLQRRPYARAALR